MSSRTINDILERRKLEAFVYKTLKMFPGGAKPKDIWEKAMDAGFQERFTSPVPKLVTNILWVGQWTGDVVYDRKEKLYTIPKESDKEPKKKEEREQEWR